MLMDDYDAITTYYKGWTLTEIRELSVRERRNWLLRAIQHATDRAAAMRESN